MKKALKTTSILAVLVVSFIACDKDFSSINVDSLEDNLDNLRTGQDVFPVIAYSKKIGPVQTNNLPINGLGVYNDPSTVYGTTVANFVTQLTPSVFDPTFSEDIADVVMDSVVLSIPYFSHVESTDADGNSLYELDSIFPKRVDQLEMRLTAHRSNYFLRNFDPSTEFEEAQRYYSDRSTSQSEMIPLSALQGDVLLEEISDFSPSKDPILLYGPEDPVTGESEVTERKAPGLRVKLDTTYWRQAIIAKQGALELTNAANFRNYFRGIYFKVEPVTDDGELILLNFATTEANITMYYSKQVNNIDTKATYTMNFSGNSINLFNNDFTLTDGDAVNGDEKLVLKGEAGSMAIINLFNGDNFDDDAGSFNAFETFKKDYVEVEDDVTGNFVKSKRLVNEAHLIFHVDQSMIEGGEPEPDRIYLYDLNNKTPLVDFVFDPTANNTSPLNSRIVHSGRLKRVDGEVDGDGITYKIRITEHINNMLLRDSTNVKLGLVVTGNINLEDFAAQNKVLSEESDILTNIPVSSIITPKGTVLFGNNTTDEDKKLRLKIFFTEHEN